MNKIINLSKYDNIKYNNIIYDGKAKALASGKRGDKVSCSYKKG